jgi:hypothetical protein
MWIVIILLVVDCCLKRKSLEYVFNSYFIIITIIHSIMIKRLLLNLNGSTFKQNMKHAKIARYHNALVVVYVLQMKLITFWWARYGLFCFTLYRVFCFTLYRLFCFTLYRVFCFAQYRWFCFAQYRWFYYVLNRKRPYCRNSSKSNRKIGKILAWCKHFIKRRRG